MRIHASDGFVKKHKCYMCDMTFAYRQSQLDHMKTVHGTGKIFKCGKCSYATNFKKFLLSHEEKIHNPKKKHKKPKKRPPEKVELRCNLCKYQSRFNGQLLEHFDKKHKDFRGFKCELCDDFDSAVADVHSNTMGNGDQVVDKMLSFIRFVMCHRMALDRHKREVHEVVKEYPCEICDHISGNKGDMKKHQEMCHSNNWWPKSTTSTDLPGSSEDSDEGDEDSEDVISLAAPDNTDVIAAQIDDVAKIYDKGADNEDGFQDSVIDENADEGLPKSICKDSIGVKESCEKTNVLDDVPRDTNNLSKHFIVIKGTRSNPSRIQCAHCTMLFAIKREDYSGFIYHLGKTHNISWENQDSNNVQVMPAEPTNQNASDSQTKDTSEDTTDHSENSGENVSRTTEADMDIDYNEALETQQESPDDKSSMQNADRDIKESDEDANVEETMIERSVMAANVIKEDVIEILISHHDKTNNSENGKVVSKFVEADSKEACETLQECHEDKTSMQESKKNDPNSDTEVTIIEGDDVSFVIDDNSNKGDVIEISDEESEIGTPSEPETDIDLDRITAAAKRQRIKMRLEKAQSVSAAITSTFAPAQSTEPTTPPKLISTPAMRSDHTYSSASKPLLAKPLSDDFVRRHTQRTDAHNLECKYCTIQFDYGTGIKAGLRYHLTKFHNFSEEDTALPSKALAFNYVEFINPERYQQKVSGEDAEIEADNQKLASVSVPPTSTFALRPLSRRKCVLCHKVVPNQKDLEYHILEHYMPQLMSKLPNIPAVTGPFICAECGYHFINVSKLLWHYGFYHKYIMKFSKEYELQGEVISGPTNPIIIPSLDL